MKDLSSGLRWKHLANEESPYLIWDHFGLIGNSGISRYGSSLYSKLPDRYQPAIVPNPVKGPYLFEKLRRSKVFSTRESSKRLLSMSFLHGKSVFHGLANFNVPSDRTFNRKFKTVLTIHDLIPIIAPGKVSVSSSVQLLFCLKRLEKLVDKVVCVSSWTEHCLLDRFPGFRGRTVVIPNGAPEPVKMDSSRIPSEKTQLLCVSRFEKYKKFDLLLKLLRNRSDILQLNLVTDDSGVKYFRSHGLELISSGKIRVFSDVSDSDLDLLYRKAHVYVQPSAFEGFCLPLVEAMARSLPCIYLQGSGMDEVAGNETAIQMAKTDSIERWLSEIARAREWSMDPSYHTKVSSYLASMPSWSDVAESLADVYDKLL